MSYTRDSASLLSSLSGNGARFSTGTKLSLKSVTTILKSLMLSPRATKWYLRSSPPYGKSAEIITVR